MTDTDAYLNEYITMIVKVGAAMAARGVHAKHAAINIDDLARQRRRGGLFFSRDRLIYSQT